MNVEQQRKFEIAVDTIVRDEAYDGSFGPLSEEVFDSMAANIAAKILELIKEQS